MLVVDLNKLNPNDHDVRYWYKEIAIQLADINGNLFAIRNIVKAVELDDAANPTGPTDPTPDLVGPPLKPPVIKSPPGK